MSELREAVGKYLAEVDPYETPMLAFQALRAAYETTEPEPAEPEFVEVPVEVGRHNPVLGFNAPGRSPSWCFLTDAPAMPGFEGYVYEDSDGTKILLGMPRQPASGAWSKETGWCLAWGSRTPIAVLFRRERT